VVDDSGQNTISRRTFLFTLAAVTCVGIPIPARAFEDFKPFSFGYVTDAHLVTKKLDTYILFQQSQLFLQDCIKTLNNNKPDFVIFGGDQVQSPGVDDVNWNLFIDCAQVLSCPWSFVLGESDVGGNIPVNKMKTFGPDWKGKGIETDKPYWSQTPMPNVHLIGLDTSRPNTATGDISQEQLDWLKNDLSSNPGKLTIVFSHHPLLPPPPFDTGPPWDEYIATQGDSAREILNRSKDVRLAVSGHLHVSKIQRERDIWYVSSPSLDVYPCAFRIFRVKPESITVETYQITYQALVKKARQLLDASNLAFKYNQNKPQTFGDLCFGERQDQTAVLPLRAPQAVAPAPKKESKKEEKRDKKKEKEEKKEEKSAKSDKKKEPKEEKKKKEPKEAKGKGKAKGKGEETKEPEKTPSDKANEAPAEKVIAPASKSDEAPPAKGAAPLGKSDEAPPAKGSDTTKSADDKKEAK